MDKNLRMRIGTKQIRSIKLAAVLKKHSQVTSLSVDSYLLYKGIVIYFEVDRGGQRPAFSVHLTLLFYACLELLFLSHPRLQPIAIFAWYSGSIPILGPTIIGDPEPVVDDGLEDRFGRSCGKTRLLSLATPDSGEP